MRAISELLGQDLRCMERDNPSWPDSWQLGTEHELQMGDEAVARLRFQSGMPSDAELAGYRWTFEYRRHDGEGPQQWSLLRALGFPISPARGFLVAKDEESRDVAFFHLRKHGGTLEFRDGHELGLERWWTPMWPCEWTWQDATTELIRFKEGWWAKKLAFDIPPDTVESRQMPLLVVIGWYAILRDWEMKRFPAEV